MTFSKDIGQKYMEEETGIIEVFNNLESCKATMQQDLAKADNIRLLLQIGRRELGDSEASFFFLLLKEKKLPNTKIRILRASKESPFLSEERAKSRGNNIKRWLTDLRRLTNEIDYLRECGIDIQEREHSEPFLWRIFLLDQTAYISAYLHQRDNDQKSVVYKLTKSNKKSLYSVFDKYFEYLWAKNDPIDNNKAVLDWAKKI